MNVHSNSMVNEETNWGQAVTGVVIKDNKVLVARHTYGDGVGLLIIPGGYVMNGETPQDAIKREFLEETNVVIEPLEIIGIRFNAHDWYVAFYAEYISGVPTSDNDENSEVLWIDVNEVLIRDDVPDLTKSLVTCALKHKSGFSKIPYDCIKERGNYSLYGT